MSHKIARPTAADRRRTEDYVAGRDDGRTLNRSRRIGSRAYRNGWSIGVSEAVARTLVAARRDREAVQ